MYKTLNPSIDIQNNILHLKFKFDRDLIAQIKLLGMRWSPSKKIWYAKITKLFVENFLEMFPSFYEDLKKYVPTTPQIQWTPSSYLMDHQRKAAEFAVGTPRYCFFHDVGTGKTLTGIELFKQKRVKTLVVCPLGVIEDAWMEEGIKKFAPEIIAANLWRARKSKNMDFALKQDLCIINFESFRVEAKKLAEAGFQMLLVDESAKIKDARSKTAKALIEFAENMDYVYLFSGNPAPNSEQEYFSQARLINPMLFGHSFYNFRNGYFYSFGYGNFNWKMKEDRRSEFMEKLKSISEVVRKEDVLDLPEATYNIRKVYLDELEKKAYKDMERHLVIEIGGKEVIATNAGVKLMKLREGTSGFYLDEDKNVVKVGTSKLKELEELLEEIGDHQVIIWTHFHYEADMVEKLLNGKSVGRVDGTISNQNVKDQTIWKFKHQEIQYLVAHPASMGHGVTEVNCAHAIYFSLNHSWEMFDQSCGRIHRKGQKNKVSYFFLIADQSVDEIIYKALGNKKSVVDAVFNYIRGMR